MRNDKDLKKQFVPFIENELFNQISFKSVTKTNETLSN